MLLVFSKCFRAEFWAFSTLEYTVNGGTNLCNFMGHINVKVAYSCIVLTILVVALILLCNVIPMCVLPFLGDNTSCCQDKHRLNMSSNILNKRSAVAD